MKMQNNNTNYSKLYYIKLEQVDVSDFRWKVYEKETEYEMGSHIFEDDAKAQLKLMNSGIAFAGFTPKFIFNHGEVKNG